MYFDIQQDLVQLAQTPYYYLDYIFPFPPKSGMDSITGSSLLFAYILDVWLEENKGSFNND